MSTPFPPSSGLSKPSAPTAAPLFVLSTRLSRAALLKKFLGLFPPASLPLWLQGKVFYQRAFTPLITLWYLVFQHLGGKPTLEAVLQDARAGGADRLSSPGNPLSQRLGSDSTASWSQARQRLPESTVQQALQASGQTIRATVQNRQWHGLDPVLLDGTTYRLRPLGDIPQAFPPHRGGRNAHPYWCLARSVVAFCMASGVVLDSRIGPTKQSEQALAGDLFRGSPWKGALVVADRNFGVYSVVRAGVAAQAHLLVRLTKARAQKLADQAGVSLVDGLDQPIQWRPTRHDQCPPSLSKEPVAGRLIVLQVHPRGGGPFTLYLFTTLMDPYLSAQELAQFYGQRWQVELDLRYVKSQLHLQALECKSAAMARKLWLAGLMAYNLVRAVMGAAAALSHQALSRLSFGRSLQALRQWLPKAGHKDAVKSWKILLDRIAHFTHPQRRKPRPSEPRAMRYFKSDFPKLVGDRARAREKLAQKNAKS